MNVKSVTKTYALCPDCGCQIGTIDHLKRHEFVRVGTWYCFGCGAGWFFETNGRECRNPERYGKSATARG